MASWEMQLISRVLRKGQINAALDWGVTVDDFLSDEGRQMFNHILAYITHPENKGAKMGPNAAALAYPNFEFYDDDGMTLEALCMEVRKTRLRVDAKAAAQRINDLADEDPIEALTQGNQLTKLGLALGYSKQTDVTFGQSLNRTIQRMELIEAGVDLSKAHYPWEAFDEVTGGLTGDDYVIYYGRPKSMKSWVLAKHASYTFDQGRKPLIYTKEMHPDNIFMRMAACQARLPYQEFRMGRLNAEEKERLYLLKRMVDDMMSSDDMICLSGRDAPNGQDTVEWLQAKVEKYQPDVIFIDGIYLMTDSKGAKRQKDNFRVQNISRGLRDLVLTTEIPIVGTIQANREAAKHQDANLDEIAFSDAIGQDATVAVRVINEKNSPTIALVLGGSREFSFHGCRIHGVPATNFDYIEELTEKAITKAKEGDVSGEEGGSATAHARKPKNSAKAAARRKAEQNTKRHLRLVDPE